MGKALTIIQGKTFSDTIRLRKKPIVYKAITGISFATGAPRLTVAGHGIAEEWPGAITRFVWVLLACMMIVVACGVLWIVGGFVVGLVEEACMGRRGPDKRGKR